MTVYLYGAPSEHYGEPGGTYGAPDAIEWRTIESQPSVTREVEGDTP